MRNIAACYSEHAIKVSDSYCSGPSNQSSISSNTNNLSIQNAVTCIYKLNLSPKSHIFIKFTWFTDQFFTATIINDPKFNSNSWKIRTVKGSKRFEFPNSKVELIWDLSNAKYESGPEPITGFYIAVLINTELNLLLGSIEEQEREELKFKENVRYSLISRSVHFSGSAVYSAKGRFSEDGKNHEILIKCSGGEERGMKKNWVLCVWIDKKRAIEVKRLRWNFRGNQTIFVDGLLVDMMWDVYDWFFSSNNPNSEGCAVFMFRPRSGLDSRLWMEDKILELNNEQHDNLAFSSLICVCKTPLNFLID